jgi:hypothetical protein
LVHNSVASLIDQANIAVLPRHLDSHADIDNRYLSCNGLF